MPYKSRNQVSYLHIHEPEVAAKFDKETSKKQMKALPKKVKKEKKK